MERVRYKLSATLHVLRDLFVKTASLSLYSPGSRRTYLPPVAPLNSRNNRSGAPFGVK